MIAVAKKEKLRREKMYQRKGSALSKHGDFFLIDAVCFLVSYALACIFRFGIHGTVPRMYINIVLFLVLLNFLISFFMKTFSGILCRSWYQEGKQVLWQECIVFAVVMAFLYLSKQGATFSRGVIIGAFLLTLFSTWLARTIWKRQLRYRINEKKTQSRVLVVTSSDIVDDCLDKMGYENFYIKGLVLTDTDTSAQDIKGIPVVADLNHLMDYICTHVVDEVFLYMRQNDALTQKLVHKLLNTGVTVHIGLDRVSKSFPNMFVESFGDMTVMTTSMKVVSPIETALKRLLDIVGGFVGCCLTGILFLFVAPAIYIKSPGPIFFSQTRIGKNGRKFKFYKFRSMYMDAEERKKELMKQNEMSGLMFKIEHDPRIIPGIGNFIRKTSIDEFPQFWNVLKGDMSLVGTRPPTVDEYEHYEARHKSRLAAKPGVTGLWQVSGRNKIKDFEDIVELDNQYIQNWSLSLDIKLLFKTVRVVCQRDGAA